MVTALCGATAASAAFVPSPALGVAPARSSRPDTLVMGYLDDLSDELNAPNPNPNPEEESHAANRMKDSDKDRYGPGNWDGFVDFDEFDGGDGQMGVAGDGNTGLEKIDNVPMMASSTQNFDKSKMMSAKNAWGSSTGYADELLTKNPKMDVSRAQQLENWQSQQEVRRKTQQQQNMAEQYGQSSWDEEENYRNLASFGVERNQEFDLDETFGAVSAGDLEGTLEIEANLGQMYSLEIAVKNEYMGFADFRAAFTPDSGLGFSVDPPEGSISKKEATIFTVRFQPQAPGITEGMLVIETEDFKKTWKVIGST
jgi:hypothetical protein